MPTQFYTNGNDSVAVSAAGDYFLTFLAGDDVLDVRGGTFVTAAMGEGDDRVNLRSGDALVYGESGDDRFDVYGSGFEGHGGSGSDLFVLRGGSNVSMLGDDDSDRFNVIAASSNLLLRGGTGNDDFLGYGNVVSGDIYGDAGNDSFVLFSNASGGVVLHGGTGNDVYRYHASTSAVFQENVGEGTDYVQVARGASFILGRNIENITVSGFSGSTLAAAKLTGNALNNTIAAHANAETIFGGGGNDRLFAKGGDDIAHGEDGSDYIDAGDGNDILDGGIGNDTLQGRAGDDRMTGGSGDDTYYVDSLGDVVTENEGEGTDLIRATVSISLPDAVEQGILSGTANLSLIGNGLGNRLVGNSGDNRLDGSDGDDLIYGNAGNDVLAGGAGRDTLFGGAGADTFLLRALGDAVPGEADQIRDFETSVDTIDVSLIDANVLLAGDQAFAIQHSGVPSGTAGELWYSYAQDGAGGYHFTWYGDVDGDRVADLQFDLHSDAALPHSDWIF